MLALKREMKAFGYDDAGVYWQVLPELQPPTSLDRRALPASFLAYHAGAMGCTCREARRHHLDAVSREIGPTYQTAGKYAPVIFDVSGNCR